MIERVLRRLRVRDHALAFNTFDRDLHRSKRSEPRSMDAALDGALRCARVAHAHAVVDRQCRGVFSGPVHLPIYAWGGFGCDPRGATKKGVDVVS